MLSLNPRRHLRRLLVLTLALAGSVSGLALPGFSRGPYPSYRATIPLTLNPSWTLTGDLNTARNHHTATLLPNGKVLVVGGRDGSSILHSAQLYDPATGTWSVTGSLSTSRIFHTATLLPNSKVLIAGGYTSNAPPSFGITNSAELYDPATGTWSATGALTAHRAWHSATLLPNGKVLLAGGAGGSDNSSILDTAELYEPATGTWSATGRLRGARYGPTATPLQNGKVLVAGGSNDGDLASTLDTAELYDPATGTWSITGDLNESRVLHTATLLPSGKVLVAGGYNWPPTSLNSAELYDPAAGTWSNTGNLIAARDSHTATLLPNGKVLVAGGDDWNRGFPSTSLNSAELYDPPTGAWNNTARLNTSRFSHTATLLQNGKVLVAGGSDNTSGTLNSAELYDPAITLTANPIDDAQFFVRQHYLDFLAREPEPSGLAAWLGVLNRCPDLHNDPSCDRITVSASFFGSPEFQLKGFYAFRFYRVAFDRLPEYGEIAADMQSVTGQTPAEVYANKAAFADAFAQHGEFNAAYGSLSNDAYVNALMDRYQLQSITTTDPASPDTGGLVTFSRSQLVAALNGGSLSRAKVLRAIVDSTQVFQLEFNNGFVAMQYYGYLRRAPEAAGYNAWLRVINNNPNDFRTMVHGFVNSLEYRMRFGQP